MIGKAEKRGSIRSVLVAIREPKTCDSSSIQRIVNQYNVLLIPAAAHLVQKLLQSGVDMIQKAHTGKHVVRNLAPKYHLTLTRTQPHPGQHKQDVMFAKATGLIFGCAANLKTNGEQRKFR